MQIILFCLQTYESCGYALFLPLLVVRFASNIGLSDTAVMDMMVSTLQQQRAVTEQLRREAGIKRVPVSVAVADIVRYISEHEQEDCLLVGFSSQKVNPFREKSSCTVL